MKVVAEVDIVDMAPAVPGQEDVVSIVNLVVEGNTPVDIATAAGPRALRIAHEQKMIENPETHAYHAVVVIKGALPSPGSAQLVVPGGAAVQEILKRGEIKNLDSVLRRP